MSSKVNRVKAWVLQTQLPWQCQELRMGLMTNHIRCAAYLYLSISIPIITYYICTYIYMWSRVSCSRPTYAYTIIYTYIPPDVLPRVRFGICSESSFAYIYILVYFCTYTCYICIHAHVSTVYIYIYMLHIYIHYLHIHIGTITILGWGGGTARQWAIYI